MNKGKEHNTHCSPYGLGADARPKCPWGNRRVEVSEPGVETIYIWLWARPLQGSADRFVALKHFPPPRARLIADHP